MATYNTPENPDPSEQLLLIHELIQPAVIKAELAFMGAVILTQTLESLADQAD